VLGDIHPIANGLGADHPIPDLPFVDDSHIPLDDPYAIEAIGRGAGEGMWGREDRIAGGKEGWVAFTTDPIRHDLGWCVRWHPEHGRTVALFRDDETVNAHQAWQGQALLHRVGGYWWDGTDWYRPLQLVDPAAREYLHKKVPAAVTVSAADLLQTGGDARNAVALAVIDVDADASLAGRWVDHLALWAERRPGDRPLSECVVQVSAPELAGDQLVNVAELAAIGDIAASTLRAYIARGEAEVPPPQVMVNGRAMWSRPVAEDWAELRRSFEMQAPLAVQVMGGDMAPGAAEMYHQFTRTFFSRLWTSSWRKRWALRWRTKEAVQEVAQGLAWEVAASTKRIVPMPQLADAVTHAVLDELTIDHAADPDLPFYGIAPPIEHILTWLIRHDPDMAAIAMQNVVGEAEKRGITREVTIRTLTTSVHLDRTTDPDRKTTDTAAINAYLDRVFAQVRADTDQ
jgi:hypothetical protein